MLEIHLNTTNHCAVARTKKKDVCTVLVHIVGTQSCRLWMQMHFYTENLSQLGRQGPYYTTYPPTSISSRSLLQEEKPHYIHSRLSSSRPPLPSSSLLRTASQLLRMLWGRRNAKETLLWGDTIRVKNIYLLLVLSLIYQILCH